MGKMYVLSGSSSSLSGVANLFTIWPTQDRPCILHAIKFSNIGGTHDVGDSGEEILRITYFIGESAMPAGGASGNGIRAVKRGVAIPAPAWSGTATNATGTAGGNRLFMPTTAGGVAFDEDGWNVRVPYLWIPTPEMRFEWTNTDKALSLRLNQQPSDSLDVVITVYVEEM
jgi:hypothetical protein